MTTAVKINLKPSRTAAGVSEVEAGHPEERLHAHAIKRIYDRQTGDHVGWLYEWNTGDLVPRWAAEPHRSADYD